MLHVPHGMIKEQLVLVLDLCEAVWALIKSRKARHSNTLHLCATLTAVNSFKFWRLKYTQNENQTNENLLLPSHQHSLYLRYSFTTKITSPRVWVHEHCVVTPILIQ